MANTYLPSVPILLPLLLYSCKWEASAWVYVRMHALACVLVVPNLTKRTARSPKLWRNGSRSTTQKGKVTVKNERKGRRALSRSVLKTMALPTLTYRGRKKYKVQSTTRTTDYFPANLPSRNVRYLCSRLANSSRMSKHVKMSLL
jgi:hypothetical protein